jgi:hypothetical protein
MKNFISYSILLGLFLLLNNCHRPVEQQELSTIDFDNKKAEYLYTFAYHCIDREYPNKPGQVLGGDADLAPPRDLHPSFYGCFDWHSSVHGHWTLVTLLSNFPEFAYRDSIIAKLKANITKQNIEQEMRFFDGDLNRNFQRTYGWAWLLKLDEALREWDHPEAAVLQSNLQPLADLIARKFSDFLDVLIYPIRVGEHPNTAFGMSFAYDYAKKYNPELAAKIETKAREYFLNDVNCPLSWEPGGFDFLSPCLQEASLMLKVLPEEEFRTWLEAFLPGFEARPGLYLKPALVTDASDGKLAHLDGLNFSRAWCLFEMGKALDNAAMINLGTEHFNFSYTKMDAGEYMGSHWLASFATYALVKSNH